MRKISLECGDTHCDRCRFVRWVGLGAADYFTQVISGALHDDPAALDVAMTLLADGHHGTLPELIATARALAA